MDLLEIILGYCYSVSFVKVFPDLLLLYKTLMAEKIVDEIRQYTIKSLRGLDKCDPWDEEKGGADWIENELFVFNEMRDGRKTWYNYSSPQEYITFLQEMDAVYLHELLRYVELGGTSHRNALNFIKNRKFIKHAWKYWLTDRDWLTDREFSPYTSNAI